METALQRYARHCMPSLQPSAVHGPQSDTIQRQPMVLLHGREVAGFAIPAIPVPFTVRFCLPVPQLVSQEPHAERFQPHPEESVQASLYAGRISAERRQSLSSPLVQVTVRCRRPSVPHSVEHELQVPSRHEQPVELRHFVSRLGTSLPQKLKASAPSFMVSPVCFLQSTCRVATPSPQLFAATHDPQACGRHAQTLGPLPSHVAPSIAGLTSWSQSPGPKQVTLRRRTPTSPQPARTPGVPMRSQSPPLSQSGAIHSQKVMGVVNSQDSFHTSRVAAPPGP